MILAAYRHGLRVSELVDLRWDQVDFGTATLCLMWDNSQPHHLEFLPLNSFFFFRLPSIVLRFCQKIELLLNVTSAGMSTKLSWRSAGDLTKGDAERARMRVAQREADIGD
jgi:hypothetical protein